MELVSDELRLVSLREARGRGLRSPNGRPKNPCIDLVLYIGRLIAMPIRSRRPSPQTLRVLDALAADPSLWRYGYELGLEVGLRSGSLYPILVRLCDRGLLDLLRCRFVRAVPLLKP